MRPTDWSRACRLAANTQFRLRSSLAPLVGHGYVSLQEAAARRPRYLLHAAVAAVGLTLVATASGQPHVSTGAAMPPALAAQSPALVDLPMQDLAVAPDADAADEHAADPATPAAKPAKPFAHTVAEGESIRMLAARYGVEPLTILSANNLRDPDLLQVGQDLLILPTDGVLHTLQEGESIRWVADRYGVEVADIVKANDLGPDPDLVLPGTDLVVPGATPALPRAAAGSGSAQAASGAAASTPASAGQAQGQGPSAGQAQGQGQGQAGEPQQQAASVGAPVPIGASTAARAVPSTRTYEVQPGDTLYSIASMFGVDVNTILSSNGINDADTIKPGSELRILPVKGLEYTVQPSETLADIAWKYQVDLGVLLDYNDLNDANVIRVGTKLVVPNARLRVEVLAPANPPAPAVQPAAAPAAPAPAAPAPRVEAPAPPPKPAVAAPAPKPAAPPPAPKPAAPAPAAKPAAPKPAPAPEPPVRASGGGSGSALVANAMKYVGSRYAFGGTSPAGFDCSGFVYYVHNISGSPVGRGMWQQYNGGSHISVGSLQPGDTVFFANTYMPGLSHDGIYIGNGQFIHANDERSGVTISSMNTSYWQSHFVGATRLWN